MHVRHVYRRRALDRLQLCQYLLHVRVPHKVYCRDVYVVFRADLVHQLVLDCGEHELALGYNVVRRDVLNVEQERVVFADADLLEHLLEMVVVSERQRH